MDMKHGSSRRSLGPKLRIGAGLPPDRVSNGTAASRPVGTLRLLMRFDLPDPFLPRRSGRLTPVEKAGCPKKLARSKRLLFSAAEGELARSCALTTGPIRPWVRQSFGRSL